MKGQDVPVSTVDRLNPWEPHSVRIQAIRPEVPQILTYELMFDNPMLRQAYRFHPGQFNMLYLPGIGEAAISICSDPSQPRTLLHTVRSVGNVTNALARKQVGDQLLLRGPFGSYWPVDQCRGADVVLACGGVGLPPLRPMLYEIMKHRDEFGRVMLLYGARTPEGLLYTDEYESWRNAGIEVHVTVDLGDDHWTGHIGVVPTLIEELTLDPLKTCVLTCGPEIMMRFVIFAALARNIPADRIFLSMERSMNCALGFCGHCQLGPTFICKDGPVFSYQQMEPYFDVEEF